MPRPGRRACPSRAGWRLPCPGLGRHACPAGASQPVDAGPPARARAPRPIRPGPARRLIGQHNSTTGGARPWPRRAFGQICDCGAGSAARRAGRVSRAAGGLARSSPSDRVAAGRVHGASQSGCWARRRRASRRGALVRCARSPRSAASRRQARQPPSPRRILPEGAVPRPSTTHHPGFASAGQGSGSGTAQGPSASWVPKSAGPTTSRYSMSGE